MLDGEKGECDQECTLFASLHGKRAHPLCSLGIGTPIIYRTKDTDIYLKGWMEVCACPSTKPPPLERRHLADAALRVGLHELCLGLRIPERFRKATQHTAIPYSAVENSDASFSLHSSTKDALFSNVAACRGQRERLQPPELGLKK